MTLMTLILSSLILAGVGLHGTSGMVAAMVIGGVVCTALAMAGGFITDLKIGYWLGTTPAKQEAWKFVGTVVSAATVGGVMILLNKTYGFTGEGALVAPQANAMAAVIKPLIWCGGGFGLDPDDDRGAGVGVRAGDVHPAGAEYAAAGGGLGELVRDDAVEG